MTLGSMKSFRPQDGLGHPPAPGRNGEGDFHGPSRTKRAMRAPSIWTPASRANYLVKHPLAFRSARQKGPDLLRKARG
jgi:hypothetical protein